MDPINTHTYDGKLKSLPSIFINHLSAIQSEEDKLKIFTKLRSELYSKIPNINPKVIIYYDQIVNDKYNINNFDATNKLSAYDLLYLIAIHIDSLDINILSEQLLDMQTGNCPQGRVIRLYQVLTEIMDNL